MTTRRGSQYSIQSDGAGLISDPELKLSISNSNRYKSHSEGSDRHLHEAVQTVLHSVQRQGVVNVATNTPRSDEPLAHPQKFPQRGGNSEILQWMESTIIQTSNKKDQGVPCQNKGGNKGRSPSSFFQQAPSQLAFQEGKKNEKKNWRKSYSPSYRIPKIQKNALNNVFNMAISFMEFKDKEQRIRKPHFPRK
ncbi:hypothetical protein O181_032006 [Austropuccinia psidii MF-1]|uniref:Uncharacterized protein n=1 Tax=Austropuccinia psidii MF-1 TaxID=1389203 RepID=A0A9Q3D1K7_9BASI|nr:hypothetical protein [Austropuccinia psidii MF-1]